MKYKVTVIETFKKDFVIEANSEEEAYDKACEDSNEGLMEATEMPYDFSRDVDIEEL